jgi:hypothetical protein
MAKSNFKKSMIALVIGLVVVSCSGRSGNQQSGTAASETAQQATPSKSDLRERYKEIERPKVEFIADWMLPTDGVITEFILEDEGLGIYKISVQGITKSQCEPYKKTLESKGMVKGFDTFSNNDVVNNFTNTFLNDKVEESVLILRIYKR